MEKKKGRKKKGELVLEKGGRGGPAKQNLVTTTFRNPATLGFGWEGGGTKFPQFESRSNTEGHTGGCDRGRNSRRGMGKKPVEKNKS